MWARVLDTVRPMRVAPKPSVRITPPVVPKPSTTVLARPAPPSTPLSGKGQAGAGPSAAQLFQKLLETGVGGGKRSGRVPVPTHPRPLLSKEGSTETANTLDGSWDRKLSRGLIAPDVAIDLHGHNLATAYATLDHALEQSVRMGDRLILLVTGKPPRPESERPHARGAIRAAVGDWLGGSRHAAAIAAVRAAHPRHGGAGALYIVLRKGGRGRKS